MSDISSVGFATRRAAAGGGSLNVDVLVRNQRRLGLLQTYAPEFVMDSPSAAVALAESNANDSDILLGASEAAGFANVNRIHDEIRAESAEAQRTMWANMPEQIQRSLNQLGYTEPEARSEASQGRLFGSIPVLGEVAERAVDWGTVPLVGGALEEAQHFLGEGLEPVGKGLDTVLTSAAWGGEQVQHLVRAQGYAAEEGQLEGPPVLGLMGPAFALASGNWSPSEIGRAWNETDEDDGYIRPDNEARARQLLDRDEEAYNLAHAVAMHKQPEEIIKDFGYEPASADATRLVQRLVELQGDKDFTRAVNAISTGQVSFGRVVVQDIFGLDNTDAGLGRMTSGLLDAGFTVFADPLIIAGKASQAYRFGRHAFRLESSGVSATHLRQSDLALNALRAREGSEVGTLASSLDRVTRSDMRLGKDILAWADRVSEGFRTNKLAQLGRDLPNASTGMGHMSDYHMRQKAIGELGLDSPLGVVQYLQNRDGLLAIMGTRVGGASPKVWGLRMPTLTKTDRAAMAAKRYFTEAVDYSRFVGSTPEQAYGPLLKDLAGAAGSPRDFSRQAGRFLASKTVGSAGRTMAMLTSHTPYRDVIRLTGPDAIPEFSRLINTGLFAGMSRQTMDDFIDAFAAGDMATRAKIQGNFLEELFRRGGVQDTPFAQRFINAARRAEMGSSKLIDIEDMDEVAIPDVRAFLSGTGTLQTNMTRALFHNPGTSWVDAKLGRFWKPTVLIRIGFIARAAGEELLHTMLKYGPRQYLGTRGAESLVKAQQAEVVRAQLAAAEAAGKANEINRLRHSLADLEGSMFIAPIRSLMAGSDRMVTQLLKSSKSNASQWRQNLMTKAEHFDPQGPYRTVSGLERFADEMSLWASGVMGAIARKTPGDLTKARMGEIVADRWSPQAAAAARDFLHDPTVQRYYADAISGSTMTPWEFRSVIDEDGVPVEKVTIAEFQQGQPILQEVAMRAMPGDVPLDRVLNDPSFTRSIYTRHMNTRRDRVEQAVVHGVLPRYVGPWGAKSAKRLGYGGPESDGTVLMRRQLNDAWAHEWSPEAGQYLSDITPAGKAKVGFENGRDALNFLRRYIDGDVDEELPTGWVVNRLNELFSDAGVDMSASRFVSFLDDPKVPAAAKRWMLYEHVNTDRLITRSGDLRRAMTHAARGRLARPDIYPELRKNRLYAKGQTLAKPVAEGVSKVYVPLMPATYTASELTDDFIEAATDRILKVGGYGPEQAETIARNVAAASVNPGIEEAAARIGMVPLGSWGAADPRITDAVMAAAEDVTGVKPHFGILQVPDEAIERSTDPVLAQGLARAPHAIDYQIDGWRLLHTAPTDSERRYARLTIDDEAWDSGALDDAVRAFEAPVAEGSVRLYSGDRVHWQAEPPDGPFDFADFAAGDVGEDPRAMLMSFQTSHLREQAKLLKIPKYSRLKKDELVDALLTKPQMRQTLGAAGGGVPGGVIGDELVDAANPRRLPGLPGSWDVTSREVSDGLPEIAALEQAADRTVDEVVEILTTLKNPALGDDVLHEIVEPLNRPDRYIIDDATGIETRVPGYTYNHLLAGTSPERLPTQSYGPQMVMARDLGFDRFVREWFDGPVDDAISSIVRKPMFLQTYGEQLRNVEGMTNLLVDPRATEAFHTWADELGLARDDLDDVVRAICSLDRMGKTRFIPDKEMQDLLEDASGWRPAGETDRFMADLEPLKRYASQRHHALNLARENALNRTMQLTIPYIDDHRIRSAFQNYVGNFIPFLFAEEQFLKRWARSAIESPEMIRKAQLAMNGLRAMGTVRRDDQGREIFVYPLIGDAAELLSKPIEWITGRPVSLPYSIQMTGDVGYALPGFGDQMGMPSAGPLVGMLVEELSRMHPQLAELEEKIIGRGANRPLWQYIVPSGASKLIEAGWGDVDKGALASATIQAIQTMAINGQLPPETATPEERQEFIDRAVNQTRFIMGVRGIFGFASPAAPQVRFEHDELTEEFRSYLQADIPFEESIQLFLANNPDILPADILAATVSSTESDYTGLDMPTDEAFSWVNDNHDLVQAYPAAAAWLAPRADAKDTFSQRAYDQQLAMGLRRRKEPKDFVDDIYFRTGAEDYFNRRRFVEEQTLGLTGAAKQEIMGDWSVWKEAYFKQHPLFAVMLQDPERQQKRHQAIDQLIALSARTDQTVPDDLAEMMRLFQDFQLNIAALRGDRRRAVSNRRSSIVSETVAKMQWMIARNPQLAAPYLRLLEPELRDADEEAVMQVVDDA